MGNSRHRVDRWVWPWPPRFVYCLAGSRKQSLAWLRRTSPLGSNAPGYDRSDGHCRLAVCIGLAAFGQSGRQHLAFIGYLLTFYLVTLALETWLAVKRAHIGIVIIEPKHTVSAQHGRIRRTRGAYRHAAHAAHA